MARRITPRAVREALIRVGVRPMTPAMAARIEHADRVRFGRTHKGLIRRAHSAAGGDVAEGDLLSPRVPAIYGRNFGGYVREAHWLLTHQPPRPGQRVAEIGFGGGAVLLAASRLVPRTRFVGFETSRLMTAGARKRRERAGIVKENVKFIRHWSESGLPVRTRKADQVWVQDASREPGVLDKAAALVKPGGVVKIIHYGNDGDFRTESRWIKKVVASHLPGFRINMAAAERVRTPGLGRAHVFSRILITARRPADAEE
ncbi:methyltransferase domain-containing protein [Candidatus Micrarchaeota archaeon]|nr:methyltransferase domain-containing protein [Candidatus Micrarchaeota archaeon]